MMAVTSSPANPLRAALEVFCFKLLFDTDSSDPGFQITAQIL